MQEFRIPPNIRFWIFCSCAFYCEAWDKNAFSRNSSELLDRTRSGKKKIKNPLWDFDFSFHPKLDWVFYATDGTLAVLMPRTHGANKSILFAQISDKYEVTLREFAQIKDNLFAYVYKA